MFLLEHSEKIAKYYRFTIPYCFLIFIFHICVPNNAFNRLHNSISFIIKCFLYHMRRKKNLSTALHYTEPLHLCQHHTGEDTHTLSQPAATAALRQHSLVNSIRVKKKRRKMHFHFNCQGFSRLSSFL